MMDNQKILIIGLDGFTWRVGNKLLGDNRMPALDRMLKTGCRGTLRSVIPYETSPAWSSFQTGCKPEKTGIFAFHQYSRGNRQIVLNSAREIKVPTLWELVSRAGKKVVSINMPLTSPPPAVDGVIIPGLTCPELSEQTVHPGSVYRRYIKPQSNYQIVQKQEKPGLSEYVRSAAKTEDTRCDVAIQLMKQTPWDLFSVQIQSTDAFQHVNWWALDPEASGYTADDYAQAAGFYEQIDHIIGRLMAAAGESTLTVIVSDHGFCAKKAEIGINTWLKQNGYLSFKAGQPKQPSAWEKLKKQVPVLKKTAGWYGYLTRRILPAGHQHGKGSNLYSERVMRHIRQIIDLDNTFAFCLGGMAGALYLVDPTQKERSKEMIDRLLAAYGPGSTEPLITEIKPVNNAYHPDGVPDYLILFAEGVEARISPDGDRVVRSGITNAKQTGTHHQDGIIVVSGPGIQSSYSLQADIVDVMPTLLAYLSIPLPDHLDGKVLDRIFKEPLPVQYQTIRTDVKPGIHYTDTDQSAVEKQLKDLGYL